VQLEAGQLDREHVVRVGVHDRLDDRQPDVADGDAAQPGGPQDRVEHLDGGGLAVGAGDGQPGGVVVRVAQPPGQLDLAPDRHPAVARLGEQRAVGAPAGRGDQHVDVVGQRRGGTFAEPDLGAEHLEQLGLLGLVADHLVERGHRGTEVVEVVGGGKAGHAEAGDHGPDSLPGVVPTQVPGVHYVPATHSA
jgi:hypothetical protein